MSTPLGYRYLTDGMGSPELAINQNLLIQDVLSRGVLDRDLTAPPGSPADGDAYIVNGTATGVWAGHEDQIAYWFDEAGVWKYIAPETGLSLYIADEDARAQYIGSSSGWEVFSGLGVGTVTSVGGTGTVAGLTLTGTVTSSGNLTLGGTLSVDLTTMVTGVLPLANMTGTTVGKNVLNLTNPSAIRFLRLNADNTVDALSDSDFRTAIGAGTGSYTAGVGLDLTGSDFSIDSTVATLTGTQTLTNKTLTSIAARSTIDSTSGTVIDWATDFHTRAISGNTTFTFSNVPSSTGAFIAVRVTLTGLPTLTWPAAVVWADATTPTLASGKTYIFCFQTDDSGTTVRATSREFAS